MITTTKKILTLISALAIFIIVTKNSESVRIDIQSSINDCIHTIIPTLFPFILLSSILNMISVPAFITKPINRIFLALFNLSENSLITILTGLSGGYNVSCINSSLLYESKRISAYEAEMLTCCFSTPGISMSVFYAGKFIYGSEVTGLIFLISSVTASFLTAIIFRKLSKNNSICLSSDNSNHDFQIQKILTEALNNTIKSCVSISAWIIFFSFISAVINSATDNYFIRNSFLLLSEITSSLKITSKEYPLIINAFILDFGGICILLQQIPYLIKLKISLKKYMASRIAHALIATLLVRIITYVIPMNITASAINSYKLSYHSYSGSVILIFMISVFIYSADSRLKLIKLSKKSQY